MPPVRSLLASVDQAAFMVALLVPGIGKEDEDGVERAIRDAAGQDLDGIVANDAQVGQGLLPGL